LIDDAMIEYRRALAELPSVRLSTEVHFRLGRCHEQRGEREQALRSYQQAAASPELDDPFRLLAVARCAAMYEARRDFARALEAYRDLIRNAGDRSLAASASERITQLDGEDPH
jgi:lipopolysaccharide biosynthesis regulator YciM